MKALVFIAILLMLSITAFTQNFRYNKVIILKSGYDCFGFDSKTVKAETGDIVINNNSVSVGNKVFTIKKKVSENFLRAKGCDIVYIYQNNQLVALKMAKPSGDYYYMLNNEAIADKAH
jgi:hypothetical protein